LAVLVVSVSRMELSLELAGSWTTGWGREVDVSRSLFFALPLSLPLPLPPPRLCGVLSPGSCIVDMGET
jgi:hypothetical protein